VAHHGGSDENPQCRGVKRRGPDPSPPLVYTIGHSNRTLGELVSLLRLYRVELLVDVRRRPGSRRCPWFDRSVLEERLPEHGIGYLWLGELLGGLDRRYPDYMCSRSYQEGISRLVELAREKRVAIMCAEAYWRRCHRRYIAESLYRRGFQVLHIIDAGRVEPHRPLEEEIRCY